MFATNLGIKISKLSNYFTGIVIFAWESTNILAFSVNIDIINILASQLNATIANFLVLINFIFL